MGSMINNGKSVNLSFISVIVPVYNMQNFLSQCIESIINQTYENLEIILVDDGSTDGSSKICDEYAQKDKRVTVIHKENGGLSDARNFGLAVATGDYISFVDSDDYIHPQMYEILLYFAKKENSDMVTCAYERDDESIFQTKIVISDIMSACFDGHRNFDQIIDFANVVAWCRLYKKTVFDGITFPVGKLHEDEYTIHRILYKCKNVVCLREKLYFYRRNNNSITSTLTERHIHDALNAFEDRIDFALEHNWLELLPSALRRYPEYCFYAYNTIKEQKDKNYLCILKKIRQNLKNIIKKYGKKNFSRKYICFSNGILCYSCYLFVEEVVIFLRLHIIKLIRSSLRGL